MLALTIALKGNIGFKMIFNHVEEGLILSIFTYFIFVEAKFKLTKTQKESSD